MRRKVSVLALVLIAGTVAWFQLSRGVGADEPIEREFVISTDPAVEVLRVTYAGGMSGTFSHHRLYGDGRFLVEIINAQNNEVLKECETRLSDEELHALVSMAVHGGLVEYDHEAIERMLRGSYVHDAGAMSVTVHLERYRGPGQSDWRPATASVSLRGASTRARRYPDVEAFQALVALGREINKYRKLAEAIDED